MGIDGSQAVFQTARCAQYPDPLELTPVSDPDVGPTIEVPPLFVDGRGRAHYTTQFPPQPVPPALRGETGWCPSPRASEWIVATDPDGKHVGHQSRERGMQDWTLVDWLCYAADTWGVVDVCDPQQWPAGLLDDLDLGGQW